MKAFVRNTVGVGIVGLSVALPAYAQFDLSHGQRAMDGTVYEVIVVPNTTLSTNVDEMRVTTIAGAASPGAQGCSNSGAASGQATSALVGTDPMIPQMLHPYSSTTRTGVLSPNDLTINFNSAGAGRLTIGSGGGAIDVCRLAGDCSGGATDATILPLSSDAGGIPKACVRTDVVAGCFGSTHFTTFGFESGTGAGDPPPCPTSPTTNTTVCASPPSDGFTIGKGQVAVFIYNHSLANQGFTYAAGGFGVDVNGDSGICTADRVLTADAQFPSAPPPFPSPCGNGQLDAGELCDDGNHTNGDGCDANCTPTGCGNGIVTGNEQCDDGNLVNGDGCDNNCTPTACGNGVVTAGEQCDDGNRTNGDGCDNNCTPTGCGNGVVTAGEQCDDGNREPADGCTLACTICGNGVVTPPEECDDGNLVSGDGCDNNCLHEKPLLPPPPVPAPTLSLSSWLVTAVALLFFGRRALQRVARSS